ncbi:MAG: DUF3604 domain-containing protein [Parahaliea sp.]
MLLCSWLVRGEETVLLWGDTHLHTSYSVDAYLFMNRSADPDTAYRYAKGLPVIHPYHRARVQIGTPLDFLVVSDHAELTAVPLRLDQRDPMIMDTNFGRFALQRIEQGRPETVFETLLAEGSGGKRVLAEGLFSNEIRETPWKDIVETADRYNAPGEFTALVGWEWSSLPDAANLHRVVFLDQGAPTATRFLPFSSIDSTDPEDLWAWLEQTSKEVDAQFVAIPHNMNLSKGEMFALTDRKGQPITADYAKTRSRWEPVAEVTQIKGDSETHPILSPGDEFAEFESYRFLLDTRPDTDKQATVTPGDYARSGLLRGLELGVSLGVNPDAFGMIGSTDAHTGLASAEEDNFHGKMALDSVPERKSESRIGQKGATGWDMSASGLAAVWARENTRSAIVAAFQRKEVYASSGPRIQLRFFGGWDFQPSDITRADLAARGYAGGVPMGGHLEAPDSGRKPRFLLFAARDPEGVNLDRLQIIKGWVDAAGTARERVYDVKVSGGRKPGNDGRYPPVGNTVDPQTARYRNDIGEAELAVVWEDPDFEPGQAAFYYARVLQIPTPRHSLYDALALQQQPVAGHPPTIQERAYSSPIWYTP